MSQNDGRDQFIAELELAVQVARQVIAEDSNRIMELESKATADAAEIAELRKQLSERSLRCSQTGTSECIYDKTLRFLGDPRECVSGTALAAHTEGMKGNAT